jgi:hypothetical protein
MDICTPDIPIKRTSNGRSILPDSKLLEWSVAVDSSAFLNGSLKQIQSMLKDAVLWVCKSPAPDGFTGISADCMDDSNTGMAILRMHLPPDSVSIYELGADGTPLTEVGVKFSIRGMLNAFTGNAKDYLTTVLSKSRANSSLTLTFMSSSRDGSSYEIPLKELRREVDEHKHRTVPVWEVSYDISMTAEHLQNALRQAAVLGSEEESKAAAESLKIELKKWESDSGSGIILTLSAYNNGYTMFHKLQVLYTTTLMKKPTPGAEAAMNTYKRAVNAFSASDLKKSEDQRARECGLPEASRAVKQELFKLYDNYDTTFEKPPRVCTEESTVDECEAEVRNLLTMVRRNKLSASKIAGEELVFVADHVLDLDTTELSVSPFFSKEVEDAPYSDEEIRALPAEYSASFSVKKLQDALKSSNSSNHLQLQIPKDANVPIGIRLDTGGGDMKSYVAFVIAPLVDESI